MLTARDGEMTENQQMVRLNSGENNPYRKQVQKLKLFEQRKWGLVFFSFFFFLKKKKSHFKSIFFSIKNVLNYNALYMRMFKSTSNLY